VETSSITMTCTYEDYRPTKLFLVRSDRGAVVARGSGVAMDYHAWRVKECLYMPFVVARWLFFISLGRLASKFSMMTPVEFSKI
jgi:hypothetical protein